MAFETLPKSLTTSFSVMGGGLGESVRFGSIGDVTKEATQRANRSGFPQVIFSHTVVAEVLPRTLSVVRQEIGALIPWRGNNTPIILSPPEREQLLTKLNVLVDELLTFRKKENEL